MRTQSLFCKDGSSDKVYTVQLECTASLITVKGFGARSGGTMKEYPKYEGTNLAEAEKIYSSLIGEKLKKGYQPFQGIATDYGTSAPLVGQSPATGQQPVNKYQPMLLQSITEKDVERLLRDPAWLMQVKEDGVRAIAHVGQTSIATYSRNNLPVTMSVASKNALCKSFNHCVLDLEVVGDVVVILDLLAAGDTDLRGYSCSDRRRALQAIIDSSKTFSSADNHMRVVETAFDEVSKQALLARCRKDGSEGVVFKLKSARYSAGRGPNGLKLKFKARATLKVIAIGRKGKESITVALADGTEVGNCSTIGKDVPPLGSLVEVEYLYAYRAGKLIQPVYLSIRSDIDEADTAATLQYKGEER